jgi:hypothetical protein
MANVYHVAAARLAVFGRRHRKPQFARQLTPHRIDRPDELTSGISSPESGATSGASSRIARAASTLARAARSRIIFGPRFVVGGGHLGLLGSAKEVISISLASLDKPQLETPGLDRLDRLAMAEIAVQILEDSNDSDFPFPETQLMLCCFHDVPRSQTGLRGAADSSSEQNVWKGTL